ncbi:MAG: tetratricopeptide repeat protein, partial [Proteobacteria bacterium]|nr:tetratricopeptide repeat protein [Pseudomonadota bacterium]
DVKLLSNFDFLLNILPLTFEYLKNLAVPVNLTFYSPIRFELIKSFLELKSIFLVLLFLGSLYLLVRIYRRERAICYSIIWIILPLLPVFYLGWMRGVPAYADRYLYISCVGFSLALALAAKKIISMSATGGAQKKALTTASIILLIIASLYSIGTVRRALVWQSSMTLWEDTAKKAPFIVDARISYANQLLKAGRLEESYNEYSFAVKNARLESDLVEAHNGLGIIFARRGMIDAAVSEFKLALMIMPGFEAARLNLEKAERLRRMQGN